MRTRVVHENGEGPCVACCRSIDFSSMLLGVERSLEGDHFFQRILGALGPWRVVSRDRPRMILDVAIRAAVLQ